MSGVALVRRPSPRMADGIVTHIDRVPADAELAARQHAAYVAALRGAGWRIEEVPAADDLPDSAFVEDTMVVVGDLAILGRSGAPERRPELDAAERTVAALGLEHARIEDPGTLDGGDVLQIGSTVYVGRGGRTNEAGIEQLRAHAATRGREVVVVALHDVLHLKSAVTALPDGSIVCANDALVDMAAFEHVRPVPEEGGSHVVLLAEDHVLMAASAPQSAKLFEALGLRVTQVDISEFEKLEGCVTCLSVLVER